MICFFVFLKLGLFGIGGGLVSVSLLMQQVVTQRQWMIAATFNDLIAIAESTPGPLVVNSATFVGMQLGGIPGAVVSTVASVIPGFLIAAAIVTYLPQTAAAGGVIKEISKYLMVFTLFIIGANLSREKLRELGVRPLIHGVVLWLILSGIWCTAIALNWVNTQ